MNLGETKYSQVLLLFALASTTTNTILAVFLPFDTQVVDTVTYSSSCDHVLEEGKHLGAAKAAESDNNKNHYNNTLWSSCNQTGRTAPTMTMLGQEENKDQLKDGPVDHSTWDQLQKTAAACRANPSWWDDNDKDNEDSHSRQGDVRVNFEICNAVTGAHQWNHKVEYTDDYVEKKKIKSLLDDDDYDDDEYDDDDYDDNDDEYEDDYDDDQNIFQKKKYEMLKHSHWWIENKTDVQIQDCLRNKQTEISPICVNEDAPPFCTAHYAHRTKGDIVMLENIWTECEAVWLQALVDCMHQHVPLSPLFYEERAFGNPKKKDTYGLYKEKGGNYVTYLTGVLHRFLPGVAHSLYQAMTLAYEYAHWDHHAPALAAGKYSQVVTEHNNHYDNKKDDYGYGWIYEDDDDKAEKKAIRNKGLPHPMTMGLRTAEFLEYHTTGRLGQHRDENSIYTISVALSDPEDYKGGYFQLSPQDVLFKMPRLSGIVFFGETLHGITPITAGRRRVFVMELWPLDHGPVGSARPNIEDME